MSIADKLLTIANNTPDVAKAVNAARATASGTVIRVDDVLDVEHPLQVQLRSKNLFDISLVPSVTGSIKNNQDGTLTVSGGTLLREVVRSLQTLCPELRLGDTVTLSATSPANAPQYFYLATAGTLWIFGRPLTITQEMLDSNLYLYNIKLEDGTFEDTTISNIQIERGTTATSYTPYMTDFSTVNITRYGRNLFNIANMPSDPAKSYVTVQSDGTILVDGPRHPTTIGFGCGKTLRELAPALQVGKIYALSGTASIANRNYIYLQGYNASWFFGASLTMTDTILDSKVFFYTNIGEQNVISNLQIEIGDTPTAYEPYKEPQTATANADGKVTGLSPISPTMTMLTDSAGVSMDCTYFPQSAKDIYSRYQELKQLENLLLEELS